MNVSCTQRAIVMRGAQKLFERDSGVQSLLKLQSHPQVPLKHGTTLCEVDVDFNSSKCLLTSNESFPLWPLELLALHHLQPKLIAVAELPPSMEPLMMGTVMYRVE
jgi:hypothetical protein